MPDMQIKLAHDIPGLYKAGDTVNLALTPSDTHVPEEISTYVGGYSNAEYRADEVSPIVLVDKSTGYIRTFSSNNAFKRSAVKGDGGTVNEVDPESSVAQYSVTPRFIGSFVDSRLEGVASSFDAMKQSARLCKNQINLDREYDVFRTLLGTNTNWAAGARTAITGTDQWRTSAGIEGTTSNPIRNIQTAIEKSAQSVTGIWMNQKLGHVFLLHSEVKSYMRQMLGDGAVSGTTARVSMAAEEQVDFRIPGLPPFHICAAKHLNDSEALEFILADVVILTHTPKNPPDDGSEVSSSYTFRQRGPDGTGYWVRVFRVEKRGPLGGEMVVVTTMDAEKMTSDIAGGIITGVIGT